ncbi:MAG: tRNA-dihydrouridine synthase [Patescibacteria group bacterium]|nr:tRNA-dihydrouridine synthase [Patescibacteria group bacterium]
MSFFKLQNLPQPFFVLAPMDDVTDTVFRRVIADCAAPDLYFTEFVNVDGLQSPGRPKLLKKLRFTEVEQPLIAQIWGKNPENFQTTADEIASGSLARELGLPEGVNFAGIDLNMGCPEKNVVKNGTCSALINDPELAVAMIQATQAGAAGRLPVSVKTRLGFNEVTWDWPTTLLQQKLNMLTIHGRTRAQMSKVPADWAAIGQVRALRDSLSPDTLIVGNGDVMSRAQGEALAKEHGLDGVMVGRGIFQDPYLFAEDTPWLNLERAERISLYRSHVELFAATWRNNERPIHTLNKFCKIYINHFDGAKELRELLMNATSADELLAIMQAA